jgi:hypothetical protein
MEDTTMADQRTVTIHLNSVQQTMLLETINAAHTEELETLLNAVKADPDNSDALHAYKIAKRIVPRQAFYAAIGYLSSWNMTFPHVDIYPDNHSETNTDLAAVYEREDGTVGYAIGAVWHETHYGFHS